MWNFFDSNFFQTIMILFVGFFVFIMYRINRRDDLKKSSIILIMEIRDIEKSILKLIEQRKLNSYYFTTPVIRINSWEKYKFMFIDLLDQDEYSLVNNFYDIALRIEKERSIIVNQITMGFETKCTSLHERSSDLALEMRSGNPQEFLVESNKIAQMVYQNTPGYESDLPKELIAILLDSIEFITTTTAGEKLKKISKY